MASCLFVFLRGKTTHPHGFVFLRGPLRGKKKPLIRKASCLFVVLRGKATHPQGLAALRGP